MRSTIVLNRSAIFSRGPLTELSANPILAEAYKLAEILKGEGDAQATAIYAKAFDKDPEFYEFTRSLNAYQSTFQNKSDVLLIDPESDFFKYLDSSTGSQDQQ